MYVLWKFQSCSRLEQVYPCFNIIVQVVAANEGTFSCLYDVPGDKELEETIYAYIRSKWSI